MKRAEVILNAIAIIGILMILLEFPGGRFLLILSIGILSLLYFYLGFAIFNDLRFREIFKKISYSKIKALHILGAVGVGISLSICIIGILFRIMLWPGSAVQLLFGIISLSAIIILCLIRLKSKVKFYKRILLRVVPILALGLLLYMLPIRQLVYIMHGNNEYSKALINSIEYPDNIEYQKEVENERRKRGL